MSSRLSTPSGSLSTLDRDRGSSRGRRLVVLGSTGSIGVNTLSVVDHLNAESADSGPYRVVGLAAGQRVDALIEQAHRFDVEAVAAADPAAQSRLARELPNVEVFTGPDSAFAMVEAVAATDLCAAMVGSAGLPATLAAIRRGWTIHLANKETLVAAGPLVAPLVRRHGATILPVDSEHSAIFQCLGGRESASVKRIVLTASGGPFRNTPPEQMREASVEQALAHPTWRMGPKITIDSATMMNKALEVIEAHWLFGLPPEQIEVIIHPQSVVHSFVEFEDNSILAQIGPPDMKTPIQCALTWPDRRGGCSEPLDWSKLSGWVFEPPDRTKFPALQLAYDVIEAGGTAGAVFNAANEQAVAAFLEGRIRFGRIVDVVAEALSAARIRPVDSLDCVLEADRAARAFVDHRLGREQPPEAVAR